MGLQRVSGVIDSLDASMSFEARFYLSQSLEPYADDTDDIRPNRRLGAAIVLAGFALTVLGIWLVLR